MLPSSCSPPLISQVQIDLLLGQVWYYGMFLSAPVMTVGIVFCVWRFIEKRKNRLYAISALLVVDMVAVFLPYSLWYIWHTTLDFSYQISAINIISAPISALVVIVSVYSLDTGEARGRYVRWYFLMAVVMLTAVFMPILLEASFMGPNVGSTTTITSTITTVSRT